MTNKEIITNDIKAPNKDKEVLKKYFSHCFDKNGDFQIEKFKQSISENEISFSKESYSMDWLGKSYARLLASDPATTLLKEDKVHNQELENKESANLLLKGDNLEVLKHLTNAYNEKIKMIYIDPPYNTGGDGFVYQDDRKFTVDELQDLAGIDKERAQRILDFTQSKSNSHSAWLTFMYPRLYIAKQLLREDGVIFISIDDNEVAQLKLIMDEVFGDENLIALVPTIMNLKGNQDNFGFADAHEYFLVYAKIKEKAQLFEFDIDEEEIEKDWEEDKYGLFKRADGLRRTGDDASRDRRPRGWFPVFITSEDKVYATEDNLPRSKNDIILYPINEDKEELSWSWSKNKINNESHNLIVTQARSGGKSIYKKQRPSLGDLPTSKPKSFFYKPEYSTSTATTRLKNLFNKKVFKGPKPVPFLYDLLIVGMGKNDIVLDFFAGSGTTGEALMELNAKDGGNRKYILVQLPEPIDARKSKAAYDFVTKELKTDPTIFEITRERLIRAAMKINQELDEKNKELEVAIKSLETELATKETQEEIQTLKDEIQKNKQVKSQNNFKVFETMPIWEDYHFEAKELDEQLKLFDETKLTEEDIEALLITWKTFDGIALTEDLEKMDLAGYKAYYANDKLYLMDKDFTTESLKALLERIDSDKSFNPTSIIAFGYHFESKNLRGLAENLKSYSNKKNIDIDFITRY